MFYGFGVDRFPHSYYCCLHGIEIIGVDINSKVVEMPSAGKLHIMEPEMEEIF